MTKHSFSCQLGIAFLYEFTTRGMRFGKLQKEMCKKGSHESFPDLEYKGPVLYGRDLVVREVEAVEGLIELEAVSDGGHLGIVDGQAGDVRVEGDGEDGEGGVGAGDAELFVVAVTACKEERER